MPLCPQLVYKNQQELTLQGRKLIRGDHGKGDDKTPPPLTSVSGIHRESTDRPVVTEREVVGHLQCITEKHYPTQLTQATTVRHGTMTRPVTISVVWHKLQYQPVASRAQKMVTATAREAVGGGRRCSDQRVGRNIRRQWRSMASCSRPPAKSSTPERIWKF